MNILGIESSCDETSAAVVKDGYYLLSNVVATQIDIHAAYGGVVPEIAARSHIEAINPVITKALTDAQCTWDDIDAIAVTYAPGLVGSLLVGTLAARTLAVIHNKPLYPIYHVEAHVYANFITAQSPSLSPQLDLPPCAPVFPMLALIASGLHTQLALFQNHGDYTLIGQTQDDAIGEAFDKVAKMLGLPYPGGPAISQAALQGDAHRYTFPKAQLANPYDFSFSGVKTAVLRALQHEIGEDYTFPSHRLAERLSEAQVNDYSASFQRIAVETVVDKTIKAFEEFQPASVVIAGGVAADRELRKRLRERLPIDISYAPAKLCGDNGAMIASLGYYYAQQQDPVDPYALEVKPSISMRDTAWAS